MKKTALALALSFGCLGGAWAQAYLGAGLGLGNHDVDCAGASSCDKSDLGFKLYGGYEFTPMFAAEVSYMDFGKAKLSGPSDLGLVRADLSSSALVLAGVARAHINPSFGASVKLGVASVESKVNGRVLGFGAGGDSESSGQFYFGLGADYAFSKHLRGVLFADFTKGEVRGESGSVRLLGAGLQYQF